MFGVCWATVWANISNMSVGTPTTIGVMLIRRLRLADIITELAVTFVELVFLLENSRSPTG